MFGEQGAWLGTYDVTGICTELTIVLPSPGRFYATAIMKIIMAQLLLHYNMQLVEKDVRRWWTWRSSMLPRKGTLVRMSPRLE